LIADVSANKCLICLVAYYLWSYPGKSPTSEKATLFLVRCRLIADVFADNGFLCVVPDYLHGDPVSMDLLTTYESLPTRSLLGKAGCYAWLAWKVLGMVRERRYFVGVGSSSSSSNNSSSSSSSSRGHC
jgi:hypothetical protein